MRVLMLGWEFPPHISGGLGTACAGLTRGLAANGHHITVETAGTVAPEFDCHLLSVSPKTSNSDPEGRFRERHRDLRANLAPLRRLLARHPEHQLKFVVEGEGDVGDILDIVCSIAVNDAATGTAVIGKLNSLAMLADIKA
jgi:7-carboxy-7-deazaguanine synthase